MSKKEIVYARFDEKDIMFDAFVEDLTENGSYAWGEGNEVVCFIGQYPVYMSAHRNTTACDVRTLPEHLDSVKAKIQSVLAEWNRQSYEDRKNNTQYIWRCSQYRNDALSVYAEMILEE